VIELSEDAETIGNLLDSGLTDEGNWVAFAARLAGMPEGEAQRALQRLARENGVEAVPFLERISIGGAGALATAAVAALGSIADASAVAALQRIADVTAVPEVRKAARRSLHRLSSMRVAAAAGQTVTSQAPAARGERLHSALLSPIDGAGNRGVWLEFRRGGELELVTVLFSDEVGIKDTVIPEISVSQFNRQRKKVTEDPRFPWIDAPVDYCRHLIEQAHRKNASSGTPLPVEFVAWSREISRPENRYEQPLVYSVINAAEVRWNPRYLDESGGLFDLELFKGWILDKDELTEFVEERLAAERSGLVLAGVSGEARDRMIEERAIQTLFGAKRRAIYKSRLEEMAYVLWRSGRLEAARSAVAAALAFEPPDRPLTGHPFVRAMVRWSLEVATELVRGDRTRVVRPGVQLHMPY
jgi:hypothetical protein